MALSKLCVIALFMKDEERIAKNCNSIIEPNSVLPTASPIIDGLWFVAAQQVVTFTVVCPGKKKETVDIEVLKYSLEQYIGFVVRQAFIHYCGLHQV